MSANDIEVGALADAEAAGAVLAKVELLKRETKLIFALGERLRAAIAAEEAMGINVAAGAFGEMLNTNQAALSAVMRELVSVPA